MTADSGPSRRGWTVALLALALAFVATGWFTLSLRVAHNDARTAAGEAVGATLGVLVFVSMIGAIVARHGDTDSSGGEADDPAAEDHRDGPHGAPAGE